MDGCRRIILTELLLVVTVITLPIQSAIKNDIDRRVDTTKKENREYHNAGRVLRVSRQYNRPGTLSLAENYLIRYGYLDNLRHIHRRERHQAIQSFQHYNGLRETGKLNRRTVHKMEEPRCGLPDDVHPVVNSRKKRQTSYGRGWKQNVITWRTISYSRKMPIYKQWKTFRIAFQTWARVIPKRFKFSLENPDILIKFARGIHGDGYYNGFDGKGMTLAHAFRPGNQPLSGDTHFDDDEDWSQKGKGNSTHPDLLAVATHEFGHAIGLEHSADYDSIMSPFFAASRTELTESDIRAAQTIYGSKPRIQPYSVTIKNTNILTENTTPKPWYRNIPRTTTDSPRRPTLTKPPHCQGVDATFIGSDGYVSVIANDTLFQSDRKSGSRRSSALRSIYPNAPIPVGAATYLKGRLYLFKGSHVWRYTKHRLDYGFPKKISTHEKGEYPRAAIKMEGYRSRRIYIFGKTKFWEWSIHNDDVIGRKQYDITQFWKGVPNCPNTAITWTDKAIYFVKNDMFYKVSQRTRRLTRRFPKHMPVPWMRDICI